VPALIGSDLHQRGTPRRLIRRIRKVLEGCGGGLLAAAQHLQQFRQRECTPRVQFDVEHRRYIESCPPPRKAHCAHAQQDPTRRVNISLYTNLASPGGNRRFERRMQTDRQQDRRCNEKQHGRNQERSYQYPSHDRSPCRGRPRPSRPSSVTSYAKQRLCQEGSRWVVRNKLLIYW